MSQRGKLASVRGEDLDVFGAKVGRRQRGGSGAGDAWRTGTGPARAVLGGDERALSEDGGVERTVAADLRPHEFHPQGDPSAGTGRRAPTR